MKITALLVCVLFLFVGLSFGKSAKVDFDAIAAQLWAYEASQNAMNASQAAALFDSDGDAYLPLGKVHLHGTASIEKGYAGLFGSVDYVVEYPLYGFNIIPPYASFAKIFQTAVTPRCPVSLEVVNWFTFDTTQSDYLILSFAAMWNLDEFNRQATCNGTVSLPKELMKFF